MRKLVVAVLALFVAAGCGRPPAEPQPAPIMPSPLLGFLKEHSLDGKVSLIQFGQVGCEMSADGYGRMARMNREKTIPSLSYLRADATPAKEQADEYFKQSPPGFEVVRDADRAIAARFGATAVPTAVLVDKFGRVRYRGRFPDERKLADWVRELDPQKADAGPDVTLFGVETVNRAELLPATRLPDLRGVIRPLGASAAEKSLGLAAGSVTFEVEGTGMG